jgi:hypothetical protein
MTMTDAPLTEEALAELERLSEAIRCDDDGECGWSYSDQDGPPGHCCCAQVFDCYGNSLAVIDPKDNPQVSTNRAMFISETHNALPALLRELRELRTERDLCDDAAKVLSWAAGNPAIHWRTDGTMPHNAELMKVAASILNGRKRMIDERDEEIRELRAANEGMRKALKPFAEASPIIQSEIGAFVGSEPDDLDEHMAAWYYAHDIDFKPITVGDLRRAKTACEDAGKGVEGE